LYKRSYYEILGVSFIASQREIKRAYHQLALKHHPDRNPKDENAGDKFNEIAEAYGVLSNPQKKTQYDKCYAPSLHGKSYSRRINVEQCYEGEASNELLKDIFKDILGYPITKRGRARKGENLRYHLSIPFDVAALGKETEIEVPYHERCPACQGLKMQKGTGFKQCPRCKGKGKVKRKKDKRYIERTCLKCKGAGKIMVQPCAQCKGAGEITLTQSLTFKIPPGVETGTRLRVYGKGNPGLNGGPTGDLYIVINVSPHPLFKRKGNDIIYHLPISLRKASLGAQIEVPTLEGKAQVKIPPGVQSGKVLRLKRKGIPSTQGAERGDQQVIVKVKKYSRVAAR
jgi:molecular chaperone DnaJ